MKSFVRIYIYIEREGKKEAIRKSKKTIGEIEILQNLSLNTKHRITSFCRSSTFVLRKSQHNNEADRCANICKWNIYSIDRLNIIYRLKRKTCQTNTNDIFVCLREDGIKEQRITNEIYHDT
jgi:hypothetical protein